MKFKIGDHIIDKEGCQYPPVSLIEPIVSLIEIDSYSLTNYDLKITYEDGRVFLSSYPIDRIDALFMIDLDWAIERLLGGNNESKV